MHFFSKCVSLLRMEKIVYCDTLHSSPKSKYLNTFDYTAVQLLFVLNKLQKFQRQLGLTALHSERYVDVMHMSQMSTCSFP